MLGTFLVTFVVVTLAVGGMAVGVLFGRRPIAGSCGGLNAMRGGKGCSACSRPCAAHAAARRRAEEREARGAVDDGRRGREADDAGRDGREPDGGDPPERFPWLDHQVRGSRARGDVAIRALDGRG